MTPEKKEVVLGEPTWATFTVGNTTDKSWGSTSAGVQAIASVGRTASPLR
ncbi:MAG: hypothetical protein ACOVT5_00080 [Armatimonadaceae bacterium]